MKKAGDNDSASAVMQLLESKVPLCFRFLSHVDDDVSSSVMDFAREYIQVYRSQPLTEAFINTYSLLLVTKTKRTVERSGTATSREPSFYYF